MMSVMTRWVRSRAMAAERRAAGRHRFDTPPRAQQPADVLAHVGAVLRHDDALECGIGVAGGCHAVASS